MEFFTKAFDFLGSVPGAIAGTAATAIFIPLGFKIARRVIPSFARSWTRKLIVGGLDTKKPHVRNLVRAIVVYLEAEIPDDGKGAVKLEKALSWLGLEKDDKTAKRIQKLIAETVKGVDEELKRVAKRESPSTTLKGKRR